MTHDDRLVPTHVHTNQTDHYAEEKSVPLNDFQLTRVNFPGGRESNTKWPFLSDTATHDGCRESDPGWAIGSTLPHSTYRAETHKE